MVKIAKDRFQFGYSLQHEISRLRQIITILYRIVLQPGDVQFVASLLHIFDVKLAEPPIRPEILPPALTVRIASIALLELGEM